MMRILLRDKLLYNDRRNEVAVKSASNNHKARIHEELLEAGVGNINAMRAEARYLKDIIYEDEHIGGAIYGVSEGGWCMLVATEKRVIYLDKKPFFVTKDILTYDIVSGVQSNSTGPFSAVTLQTRNGEYALRFVGQKSASKFAKYIESRRLSGGQYDQRSGRYYQEISPDMSIQDIPNEQAFDYLASHDVGVLSTANLEGEPSGATVHYVLDEDGQIYVLTKSASKKARNIMLNPKASLSIHETGSLKTAQISATATVETRAEKQEQMFRHVIKDKDYKEGKKAPPVTSLRKGYYIVLRLTPTAIVYTDYSTK